MDLGVERASNWVAVKELNLDYHNVAMWTVQELNLSHRNMDM